MNLSEWLPLHVVYDFERTIMVKLLAPENLNGLNDETRMDVPDLGGLTVPDDLVNNLVQLFKLLSDETRLRILYYLTQRSELHVRALCELLDESQPAVSHHLALLRVAGLIERRREGKHNFYGLKTRQFTTLLDMLFAAMPDGNRWIRLDDYMLTHAPA